MLEVIRVMHATDESGSLTSDHEAQNGETNCSFVSCAMFCKFCVSCEQYGVPLLELYCSPNVNCKLQIKISKLTLNVAGFFFHLENAADWITWCYALEVYFQALKKEPLNSLFLTGDDGRNLVWTLSTSCSTASVMFKCHFLWRECCAVLDAGF
jgi:hypothetical protein